MPRCGFARPVVWCALQQPESTSCHRKRDSEGGRRLLPTLRAMTYVDHERQFRHGITYAAALAAARLLVRIQRHGFTHGPWCLIQAAVGPQSVIALESSSRMDCLSE